MKCPMCGKDTLNDLVVHNMTNEEWLCSLPTEEKARFICNLMKGDDLYLGVMSARDMIKDELNHGKDGKFVIYEWLKEIHE